MTIMFRLTAFCVAFIFNERWVKVSGLVVFNLLLSLGQFWSIFEAILWAVYELLRTAMSSVELIHFSAIYFSSSIKNFAPFLFVWSIKWELALLQSVFVLGMFSHLFTFLSSFKHLLNLILIMEIWVDTHV